MSAAGGLAGRRVVVTQAAHQAHELAGLLTDCGAEALLYPCIAIAPPADPAPLDEALLAAAAGRFDWLVLTSANAVTALAQHLAHLDLPATALARLPTAAIGPATADAAQAHLGRAADLVAEEHQAEGLAAALAPQLRAGMHVLLPQADIARPLLATALAATGATVVHVTAYRTVKGQGGVNLPALLADHVVDAVTFTSSSTVRNLAARLAAEGSNPAALEGVCIACIGTVTAATAAEVGLAAAVVAQEQSIEGLVTALESYWSKHK